VFGDIDHFGHALGQRIEAIAARGQAPLLLCHSMGGLVARSALALGRREGRPTPCAGIVTLGTPHHGCALARFGGGHNARQMRFASAWVHALAASESARDRATWVSIFSWHDSISGPAGTAWLEHADNVPFAGIGHVSLLRDPRVAAAAIAALGRLAAASPSLAARP
jgi:triacylglycerol esterase/lipase EstA (alpha/beta hydrolase family)